MIGIPSHKAKDNDDGNRDGSDKYNKKSIFKSSVPKWFHYNIAIAN